MSDGRRLLFCDANDPEPHARLDYRQLRYARAGRVLFVADRKLAVQQLIAQLPRRAIVRRLVPRGLYGPVQDYLEGVLGD